MANDVNNVHSTNHVAKITKDNQSVLSGNPTSLFSQSILTTMATELCQTKNLKQQQHQNQQHDITHEKIHTKIEYKNM